MGVWNCFFIVLLLNINIQTAVDALPVMVDSASFG
jgi:hypothetical protein